jgi:hypothetical protein
VALSQNKNSSLMVPCLFQCPRVAMGRWYRPDTLISPGHG